MNLKQRSGSLVGVAAIAVSFLAVHAIATEFDLYTFVWDDGGSTDNWTDPDNWDLPIPGGPRNEEGDKTCVTIPPNKGTVHFDIPLPPVDITCFDLGDNSRLVLDENTALVVAEDELKQQDHADISGIVDGQGGDFTAIGPRTAFVGGRARVYGDNGSTIRISAPEYESTGLWADNGNYTVATYEWPLLQGEEPGTNLDLHTIASINAGFNSTGNDRDYQKVNAIGEATIDLSGVEWVNAPSDRYDRIEFNVDSGGQLELGSLRETRTASMGYRPHKCIRQTGSRWRWHIGAGQHPRALQHVRRHNCVR